MKLIHATGSDWAYFLAIRNDPQTIANSRSKRKVTVKEHIYWWDRTCDHRYIAKAFVGWVGIVRLTRLDDSTCEIHLAVSPEFRGEGYAKEMLQEATLEAKRLKYARIIARVDSPNTPSLRAFLKAGYTVTSPGTFLLEREI